MYDRATLLPQGFAMSMQEHIPGPTRPRRDRTQPAPATIKLIRKAGLTYVSTEALTIRRQRHGRGFRYLSARGKALHAPAIKRLTSLAVPPAYEDVLYATNPSAHIQAIGRDAAGRLQYRYHPDWERVRETRKARRLARLAEALPQIRRSIGQHLSGDAPTRSFTLSAIIELVAHSAIRPGSEQYAKLRGTRGAATLLKSNVSIYGETLRLHFKAKGGKQIDKEVHAPRLAAAIEVLMKLPGRRLFQYQDDEGKLHTANAQEVNRFLREIAEVEISLKDFRTLMASVSVLEALACAEPATSKERGAGKFSMRSARPLANSAIRPRSAARVMSTSPW
jgi:DNA topoisomerase-1